jgi:hypothetical protein
MARRRSLPPLSWKEALSVLLLALLFLAILALGALLGDPDAPVPGLRAEIEARHAFNSIGW